jgi:hypothetical protein
MFFILSSIITGDFAGVIDFGRKLGAESGLDREAARFYAIENSYFVLPMSMVGE